MKLDKGILENRKFINKIIKSEASSFIFFYKLPIKYLWVQKERIVKYDDKFPVFSNLIIFEIVSEDETLTYELNINHIYDPSGPQDIYHLDDYKKITDYMKINLEQEGITENEKILYDKINIQGIDKERYYKLFNLKDFKYNFWRTFLPRKIDYYTWSLEEFYGLFKKQKCFNKSYSDFGSDYLNTFILADSKYIYSKPKVFNIVHDPAGSFSPRADEFLEEVYDYFYDGKKYICINFDSIPMVKYCSIFKENRKVVPADKIYPFPLELIKETFFISSQNIDSPNTFEGNPDRFWNNPVKFTLSYLNYSGEALFQAFEDGTRFMLKLNLHQVQDVLLRIDIKVLDQFITKDDIKFNVFLTENEKEFISDLLNKKLTYEKNNGGIFFRGSVSNNLN